MHWWKMCRLHKTFLFTLQATDFEWKTRWRVHTNRPQRDTTRTQAMTGCNKDPHSHLQKSRLLQAIPYHLLQHIVPTSLVLFFPAIGVLGGPDTLGWQLLVHQRRRRCAPIATALRTVASGYSVSHCRAPMRPPAILCSFAGPSERHFLAQWLSRCTFDLRCAGSHCGA